MVDLLVVGEEVLVVGEEVLEVEDAVLEVGRRSRMWIPL